MAFLCMFAMAAAVESGRPALADTCADLQSRLVMLEAADRDQWEGRAVAQDPYAIERVRITVLDDLAANRCRNPVAKRDRRPNRILAGLFTSKRALPADGLDDRDGPFGRDLSFGAYRTLCVRRCDGYYFPISFSARGKDIARDESACRALCPGQTVALYVQPSPTEDGVPMVSLAGEPYAVLPTAFRYRQEYDPACACGPIGAATVAAVRAFAAPDSAPAAAWTGEAVQAAAIPLPPARVPADDPDTLANRAGEFAWPVAARSARNGPVYREGPDGKVVRLVGPVSPFLAE